MAEGKIYIDASKEITNEALKMVENSEVDGEVLIRISHNPADAIIQTANERKSNLIIMGWRGQSEERTAVNGRNVDKILEQVNCEVLVVQQNANPPLYRVLVPIANPNQINPIVHRILTFDSNEKMEIKFIDVLKLQTVKMKIKKY